MLVLLFVFLLTVNYFLQYVPGVNYFDEFLTLAPFLYVIQTRQSGLLVNSGELKKVAKYTFYVFLLGVISTSMYHIQPKFGGVWRDAFAVIKFPLCFLSWNAISYRIDSDKLVQKVLPIVKFITTIVFFLGILNIFAQIPALSMKGQRYGLPFFSMGFSHNTYLVVSLYIMLAVLTTTGIKKNKWYIIMAAICVLLTLRSKPVLGLVFLLVVCLIRQRNAGFRISKIKIAFYALIILAGSFYVVQDQLMSYIGYGNRTARGATYFVGADLANSHFPLGTGFCTFASSLSGQYYSPIYYEYGLNNIEGLSESNYSYAADTFWPNIFAQYGWIGFLFYLLMMYNIVKFVHKRFTVLSDSWIAAMLLIVYALSSAFAEAFFTNDSSVLFAICLTLFIGNNHENCSADR